ncbi:methylated-DNA--[protein]-cysteine S-methyltransferase [Roseomonas elaeocarpi]|uniref:Methylated-DNA--protein-cysteine methyltransferase n=1 Tax=Roseomonas elaeocarpi TaxID=907779 RepID=A0ABV6JX19_9PROT
MPQLTLHTPLGEITLSEDEGALVALDWGRGRDQDATPLLREARAQLHDWFDGKRVDFDLPLRPHGTAFQGRVWDVMRAIPPGETLTYGAVAAQLNSSARAVGMACGANPIPIIIPCHRVVAASGRLGGYSGEGGGGTKRFLLRLEAASAGLLAGAPAASPNDPSATSVGEPAR